MSEVILPNIWEATSLETLFTYVIGGDWGKDMSLNVEEYTTVACIRGAEFKDWYSDFGKTAVLRKIKKTSLLSRQLSYGDLLIEISGGGPTQPVGRTVCITNKTLDNFTNTPIVCTNFIRLARPSKLINPIYLNYYLTLFYLSNKIDDYQSGSNNLRNLKFKEYSQISIPFPSLAEQKVIADLLDQLIAQVDKLKLHLETILTTLKKFRQSVLNAAVTGKLTEDWRVKNRSTISISEFKKNIKQYRLEKWIDEQNIKFMAKGKWPKNDDWKKKYIEPTLSKNYKHNTLPSGWIVEPLEGLIYISARIGWKGLKASEYTQKGPLFLSVHSLNHGMYVKLSEAFHISQERYDESPEIMLENNDILLCKDGAGIGKAGIVKNLKEQATINSSLLLIRAGKFFIPEYLYFFFSGPIMQGLVHERMTGSAVPHLFQRDVKEFILEVPPIEEQQEIVNRVESYFAFADKIEQQVKSVQERVNNLTPAILTKAFKGELTADWRAKHPELISGENSAEALLKRIQTEQETLTKPAKTKKVKR